MVRLMAGHQLDGLDALQGLDHVGEILHGWAGGRRTAAGGIGRDPAELTEERTRRRGRG
jgi:hypothetical protein